MKEIEDFTQFYPFLAIFYPLFVTEVIFQRGKSQKTAILEGFTGKDSKKYRKKIGLPFDSGLKSFLEAPGEKSPIHLCVPAHIMKSLLRIGLCMICILCIKVQVMVAFLILSFIRDLTTCCELFHELGHSDAVTFPALVCKKSATVNRRGSDRTDGANWDKGREPGETHRQNVSSSLSPASRFTPSVPMHPG